VCTWRRGRRRHSRVDTYVHVYMYVCMCVSVCVCLCVCVGGGEGGGDTLEVTCAGREDLGVLRISADGLPEKDSSRITGTTQFTCFTGT
jgi:hypothetical protein